MARAVFWVSVLVGAVVTAASWFLLPERVPLHFGGSGVDQWGSRTESVVFFASLVGGLALLFWVMIIVVPRTPETLVNLPARDKQWWLATPSRREEFNAMIIHDLYVIGTATLLLMAALEIMIIVEAREPDPGMAPWFWILFAIYLVGVLGYSGYMVAVRYRAPRDGRAGQR